MTVTIEAAEMANLHDDLAHSAAIDAAKWAGQFDAFETFTDEEQADNLARTLAAGETYRAQKLAWCKAAGMG